MLRRHAPDVVSLVFGTLFAGFTVIWLLNATDVIDYKEAWLAGPAILIVAGVLGLVVALRPGRPSEPEAVPWATPATGHHEEAPTTPIETDPTTQETTELEAQPDEPTGPPDGRAG